MKPCTKCGVVKPLSDFCIDRRIKSGVHGTCKECKQKYYQENKEHIRKRHVSYWEVYAEKNRESRNEKSRKYRAENAEKIAITKERWLQENRPKQDARTAAWSAILCGRIVKQSCEICGRENADAHHDDYSKPLDVRWLCRKHHAQWHSSNGEGLNGKRAILAAQRSKT